MGDIMECRVCHKTLRENDRFCRYCGAKVPDNMNAGACPRCGAVNSPEFAFCECCGERLNTIGVARPEGARESWDVAPTSTMPSFDFEIPDIEPTEFKAPKGTGEGTPLADLSAERTDVNQNQISRSAPKRLIIVLAVLALLVGAVATGFFFIRRKPENTAPSPSLAYQLQGGAGELPQSVDLQLPEDVSLPVQSPVPEKMTTELAGLLACDIGNARAVLGIEDRCSESGNTYVYLWENITVTACEYGTIHSILVQSSDEFSLDGVRIGDELSDAESGVLRQGYRQSWAYAGNHGFQSNDGTVELVIEFVPEDAPVVGRIFIQQNVVFSPSCSYCGAPSSEYLLPDSDSRYLSEADIAHLSHEELCFARNEIFARHGWIFSVDEIAEFFAGKAWYRGTVSPANFDYDVLNEYEKANIRTISTVEKNYYGGSYY